MKFDIQFKNDSGEEIPPYGVIRVKGVEMVGNRALILAGKPNTYGSQYLHYINGITAVANGKCGTCSNTFPCLAIGTGSIGDTMGPRAGVWSLNGSTGGFVVIGQHGSLIIVDRAPMLAFTGRFDADVSKGATETVSVYWHGVNTGANVEGVYAISDDFTTADNVNVSWMNERWEAYCRD